MTGGFAFEWCLHALHVTAQGSVAALLLMPAARFWESRRPALASALLAVAFLKFLLPPMLPAPSGIFSFFAAVPAGGVRVTGVVLAVAAVLHAAGIVFVLFRLAREHAAIAGIWRRASESAAAPLYPLFEARCREAGTDRAPELRVSREIGVPFAWGVFRPAILVPEALCAALSEDTLSLLLAHEAAHARRRDPARNVFESTVAALWWFNPVFGGLIRRRRALREERCDADVVKLLPGRARDYAQALVEAASVAFPVRTPGVASPATTTAEELARRLRRIARPERVRRSAGLEAAACLAAAALLIPGVRPGAAPRSRPSGLVRPR